MPPEMRTPLERGTPPEEAPHHADPLAGDAARGPFRVRVAAERAAAYALAIGSNAKIPYCFPAVWLAAPQIHSAVMRECERAESVPVHESQKFDYREDLALERDYDLFVDFKREAVPPRLILEASVRTPGGALCVSVETVLRLVPRDRLRALEPDAGAAQ